MNWVTYYKQLANTVKLKSKDKYTQIGAVIVGEGGEIVSTGYNSFPRGLDDGIHLRQERPEKYYWFEHAERNAIYHAARHGVSLKDCKLYVTLFPCADCARAMIQSGITKLIAPEPNLDHEVWGEHFKAAIQMMEEANIKITLF